MKHMEMAGVVGDGLGVVEVQHQVFDLVALQEVGGVVPVVLGIAAVDEEGPVRGEGGQPDRNPLPGLRGPAGGLQPGGPADGCTALLRLCGRRKDQQGRGLQVHNCLPRAQLRKPGY